MATKTVQFFYFVSILFSPILTAAVELTVVTENWKPYNYEENGEIKGISTGVVKKVLEHAKILYTLEIYPWGRAYQMARYDKNVLIYTIIRVTPREKQFQWVRPIGKGGTSSLYRLKKNVHIQPNTLKEAQKYDIVAYQDSMDHLWLQYQGFTNLETPPSVRNSLDMFFKERVHMIAFDSAVMKAEFQGHGFDIKDIEPVLPLFATPPYIALSLSTPKEILTQLQSSYDDLLATGQITPVN